MKRILFILLAILSCQLQATEFVTTKAEAYSQATAQNRKILLIIGRDGCANTEYVKNTLLETETPGIKNAVDFFYTPWYVGVDTASQEWKQYLNFSNGEIELPIICCIDPTNHNNSYLDPEGGRPDSEQAFYTWLVSHIGEVPQVFPVTQTVTGVAATHNFELRYIDKTGTGTGWSAKSDNSDWLTLTTETVTGSTSTNVDYKVTANYGTEARTGTITITSGDRSIVFTVTQGVTTGDPVEFTISKGWNLLSTPFPLQVSELNSSVSGVQNLYILNETNRYEAVTDVIPANRGFWLYTGDDGVQNVTLYGEIAASNNFSFVVEGAWNMMGPINLQSESIMPTNYRNAWIWNRLTQSYNQAQQWKRGIGYYIYVEYSDPVKALEDTYNPEEEIDNMGF